MLAVYHNLERGELNFLLWSKTSWPFQAIQKFKGRGPWNVKIPPFIYEENPEMDFLSVIKVLTELSKWSLLTG